MPNEAEGIDKRTNELEPTAQVSPQKSGPYDLTKSEAASTIERFKPRRMEPDKAGLWKHYSWERFNKMARQRRTTPSLTKFKDDIIRACQFALDVKWENCNNAQMRRRGGSLLSFYLTQNINPNNE